MIKLWGAMAGILLYMEIVYHLGCFGLSISNPLFILSMITIVSGLQTGVIGWVPKKWKKPMFWIFLGLEYLLVAAQMVYLNIFRQPLLWEATIRGGQDAITNYWRETLAGIWKTMPFLVLLALPFIAAGVLIWARAWRMPRFDLIDTLRVVAVASAGVIVFTASIIVGKMIEAEYYDDYKEFYDPLMVAENMGMLTMVQRDTTVSISSGIHNLWNWAFQKEGNVSTELANNELVQEDHIQGDQVQGAHSEDPELGMLESDLEDRKKELQPVKEIDTSPNVMPLDMNKLAELSSGVKETEWLANYISELTPTNRNEYTGMFEGYNLIYITAEGFSTYGIHEELTPTLYRLVNSGFVFNNYYAPLWQTSTSDGEYINCTALIPDGQFSLRKSSTNDMGFSIPRFFEKEGVTSMAYHNNSLSYYDRHITHNNLGYDFKAAKLGDLEGEEWEEKIFPMENPNAWPASDWEMMQGTVGDYLSMDRFHVYYMTVSGHMNYSFKGNSMSAKNQEAVMDLPMSENAQAYIACHIELEKAMDYLLKELEKADKLENTVICISTDHYPYGMTMEEYEELAGKSLEDNLDLYRNSLILWNAELEEKPIVVDKVCGSMDVVPTLLNLFGFEYDSRMYAGRDIFSEEEGLVIMNDRSFVTDTVCYNRKAKNTTIVWEDNLTEEELEQYMDEKKLDVKQRYQFSAYVLQQDYYATIKEALNNTSALE